MDDLASLLDRSDAAFADDVSALVPVADDASLTSALSASKKRQRTCMKDELAYLRAKHAALAAELALLQVTADVSIWKGRAFGQVRAAQQAQNENMRLRTSLASQLKVLDALQKLFLKQPSLCQLQSIEHYKVPTLGVERRKETLEALLQHQYEQLPSQWVRHGLHAYEANDDGILETRVHTDDGPLRLDILKCDSWPVAFTQLAHVVWQLLVDRTDIDITMALKKTAVEVFSDTMVYAQYVGLCTPPAPYPRLPPVESRIACRRFDEATRVVIVWRSILDDALFPTPQHHLQGDECGWVVVQQKDAKHARLLSYSTTKPPLVPELRETNTVVRAPGMLTESLLQQVHASCDAVDLTIQRGLATVSRAP
ncbi:hypothetical protein SDRG_16176 [Saprolegnia diclina VS20]|uniref:START domain-containing protein n=1 Tax=Saprolegnia diclina (strain VS20) TaxID=1156394 RepID=T0R1U9_SAPDV|nr:hypothetical protein SDRG_16176 [Saprolegnia diclina VS20]EQC25958.1 hypothetical protein SDRG_16176 [Saprolegnia diclina VS20]|eukprot:XP_008620597.1 hypothetical protein SDRG_16176 [Saprolegnia diclina VS20]